ncbi:MAG: GtrA family protein [Burkholderiales bacterium]|nr:GtrA family protein [Burkholderiales bacterium]
MTRSIARTAPRYLAVGVLNTFAGLGVIFVAKAITGAGDVAANIAGYGSGLALSYILNKHWTFAHRGPSWSSLLRFVLVFALSYMLNLGTVLLLIGMGVDSYAAQAAGTVPYAAFGYLASRSFVFGTDARRQN